MNSLLDNLFSQVYQQAVFYCKPYEINAVCAYGGGSKYEQSKALEEGSELVICTPVSHFNFLKYIVLML